MYKNSNDNKKVSCYNLISILIDNQIEACVQWLNSDGVHGYFLSESEYQLEVFEPLEDEWDSILEAKFSSIETLLCDVYIEGKSKCYEDIGENIKYAETDKLAFIFARNYNFSLIRRLDNNVRNQIKNKIMEGFLAGIPLDKIVLKILKVGEEPLEESTVSPKQRAKIISKTGVCMVHNIAVLQSYVNEGFTEVKILPVEDSKECHLCLGYPFEFNEDGEIVFVNHGEEIQYDISKLITESNLILFYPNYRCVCQGVFKSKCEPPLNPLIVNLISGFGAIFLSEFHDNSDTFDVLPYEKLIEDKFPNDLPNLLKKGSIKFDDWIQNANCESMYMANLTTDVLGEIYTNNSSDNVTPKADFEIRVGDELIAVHNHRSHMPFNTDDFELIFENQMIYVKYLVVHTPTDIFICELDSAALPNKDIIIDELASCYGAPIIERGVEDYITAGNVWENFKSNKLLNKYMSFRRIRK